VRQAQESYIRQVAADAGVKAEASPADELAKLADLHQQGVLSEQEFAAQKARVLA
jgi:hypothetical protein